MSFPVSTFGVPIKALGFSACTSVEALRATLENLDGRIFIVGGGSNILPVSYLNAHIVHPDIQYIHYEDLGDSVYVTAGAGVVWHALVLDTLRQGLSGLENLSLIPGCAGAAPIQNIGAYGVELSDRLVEVELLDIHSNEIFTMGNEECDFAYRDSIFKHEMKGRVIITGLTLRLDKKPVLNLAYGTLAEEVAKVSANPTAQDVSDAVIAIRQSKLPDPNRIGNAGSFFKNPVVSNEKYTALHQEFKDIVAYKNIDGMKLAAAWLIDACGLKGYQHLDTDAGIHDKQALVLVNRGTATGEQILAVAVHVQRSVYNRFGVLLKPEVQIVGDKVIIDQSGIIL